jgi:hypothetical protein
MEYWLYDKLDGKPNAALEHDGKSDGLIALAKRMTRQWEQVGITRHYIVKYGASTVWEN